MEEPHYISNDNLLFHGMSQNLQPLWTYSLDDAMWFSLDDARVWVKVLQLTMNASGLEIKRV